MRQRANRATRPHRLGLAAHRGSFRIPVDKAGQPVFCFSLSASTPSSLQIAAVGMLLSLRARFHLQCARQRHHRCAAAAGEDTGADLRRDASERYMVFPDSPCSGGSHLKR